MSEEIKLTKREPTWNYILNDLALYSLMTKVIHSEEATYQEKFDLMYQIKLLQQENSQLKEEIKELELHVGLRQKRNLISKFDKEYDLEDKKKNPNRTYACIMPDAEEVYKRYYDYKERIEKAIAILNQPMLSYASCVKALDELEEILKGE